jgi:hypothetical protein
MLTFIIASIFHKSLEIFSSITSQTHGFILFNLSTISCALDTVLFEIINFLIHLFTNSSAIHLAVHQAHNINIFLSFILSQISVNLSVKL